jgi:rare lipoprotein A
MQRGGLALALAFSLAVSSVIGCAAHKPADGGRVISTARGSASYYGHRFHGRKTASGERFDMHAFTAAHRTLAMGTHVRVTNLDNGRKVVVRINDRGPFHSRRIIDVSYAAARELGMLGTGVAPVKLEVLGR